MKKLSTIISLAEIELLSDKIINAYNRQPISDARLTELMADFKQKAHVMMCVNACSLTVSILDEMDTVRDNYWTDLMLVIKGYCHSILPDFRFAAEGVARELKPYGSAITRENFERQTALMDEALRRLSLPDVKTQIEQLPGVAELIEAIQKAQLKFCETAALLTSENQEFYKTELKTNPKKELVSFINDQFLPYLEVMCKISDDFVTFFNAVEETISDVNSRVSKRLWH